MTVIDSATLPRPLGPAARLEGELTGQQRPGHGRPEHPAAGARTPPAALPQDLLLELAGVHIPVSDTVELPPGAGLNLALTMSATGTILAIKTAPGTRVLPKVIAEALREYLPKSGSLAPLLAELSEAMDASRPANSAGSGTGPTTATTAGAGPGNSNTPLPPAHIPPAAPRLDQTGRSPPPEAQAGSTEPAALPSRAASATVPIKQPTTARSAEAPTGLAGIVNVETQAILADGGRSTGGQASAGQALPQRAVLPEAVAQALATLAAQVPDVARLYEPGGVARALQRSGLMLEAHLADPRPELEQYIKGDLKAALLQLRETVTQERTPPERPGTRAAEAAVPATTGTAEQTAALKNLSDSVDGALARISLNQVQVAQADPAVLTFCVELPVRLGNGSYEPVEMSFEREAEGAAGLGGLTTLTLRMRPPDTGPITAVLRLRGEHISTELWAEAPGTRAQLFQERERLSEQLRAAGLDAATVSVSQKPPVQVLRLPQGLVNTTV